MTEKEFNELYEEKIEEAIKRLPNPNVFSIPVIEVPIVFDDLKTICDGRNPPPKRVFTTFFVRKMGKHGFYWEHKV